MVTRVIRTPSCEILILHKQGYQCQCHLHALGSVLILEQLCIASNSNLNGRKSFLGSLVRVILTGKAYPPNVPNILLAFNLSIYHLLFIVYHLLSELYFQILKWPQCIILPRTKATSILNIAVAPLNLVKHMKCHAFSLAIDGTNDWELQKMNPITVRIYNNSVSKVVTHFLDMCTTTSATAEAIFNVMDLKLVSLLDEDTPWLRCTSFGVDNTCVNIGSRNSL